LEPWFVQKDSDGKYTVTVPSDIEAFADDPAVMSCTAAIHLLGAQTVEGLPMARDHQLWQRCHKDVDLYYYGIAALLKDGTVGSYPNYSGWFGKGYNLVARRRLNNEGIKPWAIRGSTTPLRKIWSHKAWGESLPRGYKHLEVLIREAADHLKLLEKEVGSWMVPLSVIKGSKLKKSLTVSKTGFLLQPDIDALNLRFKAGIDLYGEIEAEISKAKFSTFIDLEDKILTANKAVQSLERLGVHIIDTRAKLLYPTSEKPKGKKPKKTPLKEKLLNIDPVLFINRFGPYEACGIAPFTTSEEAAFDKEGHTLLIDKLETELNQYIGRQRVELADILRSWWNTEFLPRYG
jgi:hypothetical protein